MKKLLAVFLTMGMLLSTAACSTGSTPAEPGSAPAGSDAAPASSEEQSSAAPASSGDTLALWHYWNSDLQQGLLQDMVDGYEQESGVKIEVSYIPYGEYMQKILVSAAGNVLPELFLYDANSTATLVEAGVLADITSQIESSGIMKNTLPYVVEQHTVGDKLYGFPCYANCVAFFYRTDLIETPPTNWTELYETAKAVATDDMYGFAMAGEGEDGVFQFLPFLWSAGADLDNVAAPGGVEALDLLSKMIDEGLMSKDTVTNSQEDARVLFETGRAAMMLNGPWNVPPLQENAPDMKWDITMIPKADNGEYTSILGGESFGIGNGSDVESIWKFVEYVLEPSRYGQFLKDIGQLPADTELAKDPYYQDDPINKIFIDQLVVARPRAYGPQYNEMSKAIQVAMGLAMGGQETAQQAMDEAAATITPMYNAFFGS